MLRFKLTPYERAFTFQILSQERVIKDAIASVGGSYITSNGWKIQTKSSPELKVVSKRIYLRGSNTSKDYRIDRTWNIPNNHQKDHIIVEVEKALTEVISFARDFENSRYYDNNGYKYLDMPLGRIAVSNKFCYPVNDGCDMCDPWRVNFASEAKVVVKGPSPVSIDANGWGPNKPRSNRITYVA